MNRSEFAEKLAKKAEIPQTKARQILDIIFSTESREGIIAVELDAGRDVTITGFGTYTTRHRKAREGRNPQTGKKIQIGASIGHVDVTAGTIGAFVSSRGVTCVLSNNHVLANEDLASRGDAIVQPGTFDGGQAPRDRVATLTRWVRLKPTGVNLVDAAIARVERGIEVDPTGLRDLVGGRDRVLAGPGDEFIDAGTDVFKVGRTTGARKGRVTAFDLDNVVVGFDIGNIRFDDQIEIEGAGRRAFSDGGDSGSLIVDSDMQAVALLFAGSESGGSNGLGLTYANPIHEVLSALRVELRLR